MTLGSNLITSMSDSFDCLQEQARIKKSPKKCLMGMVGFDNVQRSGLAAALAFNDLLARTSAQ